MAASCSLRVSFHLQACEVWAWEPEFHSRKFRRRHALSRAENFSRERDYSRHRLLRKVKDYRSAEVSALPGYAVVSINRDCEAWGKISCRSEFRTVSRFGERSADDGIFAGSIAGSVAARVPDPEVRPFIATAH